MLHLLYYTWRLVGTESLQLLLDPQNCLRLLVFTHLVKMCDHYYQWKAKDRGKFESVGATWCFAEAVYDP